MRAMLAPDGRWILSCAALWALTACGARTGLPGDDDDDLQLPHGCTRTDEPTVYVVSSTDDLYSFDPPRASLSRVGHLECETGHPNSMAVSRTNEAFVGYQGGHLYRVSTKDARCEDTPFDVAQLQADRYGMGFSADPATGEDTLFIAESFEQGPSRGLEYVDTTTFDLHFVGAFDPPLLRVELTGTGDGRLYGFAMDEAGSRLVIIDEDTAQVRTERTLDVFGASFAFAFWGGDFYLFTSEHDVGSTVSRYSPATGSLDRVGTVGAEIVGAGVSTCAPL
jgi:hypothetical protein